MSQAFSQSQDPAWTTLPVVKFSHNTSPYGTRNFTWTHVNHRSNIDITFREVRVVDEYGSYQTRTIMKITSGAEVLETHDLGDMVKVHQDFDPSTGIEHPVDVVVKTPFLAMRYPKNNNVRRIQVKFHNDLDFTRAWHFMRNIGLPITDRHLLATSIPQQLPSPAPTISSMTSTSSAISSADISSMSRPSSISHTAATTGREVPGFSLSVSSGHQPGFRIPQRPVSVNTDGQFPHLLSRNTSLAGLSNTTLLPTPFNLSTFTGPALLSRVNSFRESSNVSPFSYSAQMERETQSRHLSNPASIPTSQGETKYQPPSIVMSQIQSQQRAFPTKQNTPRILTSSPFFPPSQGPTKNISATLDYPMNEIQLINIQLQPQESINEARDPNRQLMQPQNAAKIISTSPHSFDEARGIDTQRPFSTPLMHTELDNLWIPPKRELPFNKPRKISKPLSTTPALSPLPKPTVKKTTGTTTSVQAGVGISTTPVPPPISKPATKTTTETNSPGQVSVENGIIPAAKSAPKKRVAQRKARAGKQTNETLSTVGSRLGSTFKQCSVDNSPALEDSISLSTASSATVVPPPKKRIASSRPTSRNKRSKMISTSTQTQTLSGRDHTSGQRLESHSNISDILANVPASTVQKAGLSHDIPPVVAVSPPPAAPPENFLSDLDEFVTKHKARPAQKELWEEPGYANGDEETRLAILNNFICENLGNVDFLQLCEDTEKAWRRIGLGM